MKTIGYMILALGALMVVASIDTIPDPPAVNPHTVDVKASCERDVAAGLREQDTICDSASISSHAAILRVNLRDAAAPHRPNDWIALSGHAADPSPPRL